MLKKVKASPSIIRARRSIEDALVQRVAREHNVDPDILKAEFEKQHEKDDEEDDEIPEEMMELLGFARRRDREQLEDRGILIINSVITKETIARTSRRLMVLHFDEQFTDDVQILINSPGGYCSAGWAFIDVMRFIKNKVVTVALGEICSMAVDIFVAGDERIMSPNAVAMIHQFSSINSGSYGDLLASRKYEDMEAKKALRHLLKYSKYKTEKDVRKHLLLEHDNWLSPEEMLEHGLCDKISTERGNK